MPVAKPSTAAKAAPSMKQRLVTLIHVAKRELGMDDVTYRTMLRTAGGADSTASMGVPALMKVLEQAKRAGFKVRSKPGDRSQAVHSPEVSKVRALWLFLHQLGAVQNPSESALAVYVKRITKVHDLRWVKGDDMATLIESLKKWAMRFLPAEVKRLDGEAVAYLHARAKELAPDTTLGEGWIPIDGTDFDARYSAYLDAKAALRAGEGFGVHWRAWEGLQLALAQPVAPELKAAGRA